MLVLPLLPWSGIWFIGLNFSDYASWVASDAVKIRNVFGHNTTRTDSHTSTDGDSRKHHYVTSKPTILANCDWLPELWTSDTVAEEWIEWMCSTVEGTIRSNERAGPNSDETSV